MAQKGFGEMAVSNVFGSNVFDILIALGVPWTLDLAVGGKIEIESDGFPLKFGNKSYKFSTEHLLDVLYSGSRDQRRLPLDPSQALCTTML